jgi:DNA-binding MarR family transcriptional regulator
MNFVYWCACCPAPAGGKGWDLDVENGDLLTKTHNHSPKRGDLMMLSEKYKQIAVLAATGTLQNKEIAERVGCHPNTVTRALKKPEVRALIEEMQKRMREQTVVNLVEAFDEAAGDAFEKLIELMQSGPPAVILRNS